MAPSPFWSHSVSVVSDSLRPHELQHARLPCPSVSPRVCSNSCPLSQWCHPTISSSVTSFSSCPQIFPSIRVFSNESSPTLRSWLFLGQDLCKWMCYSMWLAQFEEADSMPHEQWDRAGRLAKGRYGDIGLVHTAGDTWVASETKWDCQMKKNVKRMRGKVNKI